MARSDKLTCEQVARAVLGEPAKREGPELLYHCPRPAQHKNGDAHPSLKVNPQKDMWGCFVCGESGKGGWSLAAFLGGCDPGDKAAVKTWLREHGLLNSGKRKAKTDGRGPVVAEFVHCDADGHPVCRKLRHEPGEGGKDKSYSWERLEGGEWKSGLGKPPIIPPLYRLPQIKNESMVFLFESHSDVDRAVSMGQPATTSGGVDSWKPEYADALAGKSVCLIPDNNPPGAKFEATVCASLCGKVRSLKVVSIAPYPDFRRWADAGNTLDQVLDLYRVAPEFRPASGAEILNAVMALVRRFVSLTESQARVAALWACHTHAIEAADFTPYLNINSAEKESGKTRLLDVFKLLVANPWGTENASVAAMVRKIHGGFEKGQFVTVLFDERDSQTGGDRERAEAIRGILNSGYERGGCYSRCVGEGAKQDVVDFQTFGPKALAGIGSVSDTVASRSIPIRMKRARRGEVSKFRKRGRQGRKILEEADGSKARIAEWCAANLEALSDAQPDIPPALTDRQEDVCEPLLAIADAAGGDWPTSARVALVELCVGAQADDDSIGVKLLADIRAILCPRDDDGKALPRIERIASEDLAKELSELEGRPWAEWKFGKPITKNQLAHYLSRYGIGPKTVRLPDDRRLKGYELEQFKEAWAVYLPPDSSVSPDSKRDTVTNQYTCGSEPLFQSVTPDACHGSENAVSANNNAGCHDVTVQKPGDSGKQVEKVAVEWEA